MQNYFNARKIFEANVNTAAQPFEADPWQSVYEEESFPEVDAFVELLRKCREDLRGSTVVFVKNKERFDEIMQAADDLAEMVFECDENAEINVQPDCLVGNSVCVDVVAQVLSFCDAQRLCNILKTASSVDAYARTDGKVALCVGFDGAFDIAGAYKDPRGI